MKPDNQVRFSIIGMGNLMEVIWPCMQGAFGGADLAGRAMATTADEGDIERKRQKFAIPMLLHDNRTALFKNRPDIIFFAPPPTLAPGLVTGVLKEYFDHLRATGSPLPEVYAFPPLPPGSFYREHLGQDVLVCNIIPNNVTHISGKPVEDEGYYSTVFASPWPKESKDRFERVFASQGALVEIPAEQMIPMLGGTCAIFSLWQVAPVLAEILAAAGRPVHHNVLGEQMRAVLQKACGYRPPAGDPASLAAAPEPAAALAEAVALAWRDGVAGYYREAAMPQAAAATIVERGFDVILHTVQAEPREVLDHHAIGAATKGGVLEKAIATFHTLTKPVLERAVAAIESPLPGWQEELTDKVAETCRIVRDHGRSLAG